MVELIGGLRKFHATGVVPSPSEEGRGGGEVQQRSRVEAAPETRVGSASPFGECQVYIPAEEWGKVDQARQWAVSVVMQPSHVAEGSVKRARCKQTRSPL